MKFKIVFLTFILLTGTIACTPTNMADQVQKNERTPMSTGDDLSLRPDHDKD